MPPSLAEARRESAAGFRSSALGSPHEGPESCSLGSVASGASGIAAASFRSEAVKDTAESPTAWPGRPKKRMTKDKSQLTFVLFFSY